MSTIQLILHIGNITEVRTEGSSKGRKFEKFKSFELQSIRTFVLSISRRTILHITTDFACQSGDSAFQNEITTSISNVSVSCKQVAAFTDIT